MTPQEMKDRTQKFALRVIHLVQALPRTREADVIGRQLLRAGTSVGANYHAACRSRSDGDFMARLGIVEEEADECLYWMEILVQARLMKPAVLAALTKEGEEILAIIVTSIKTARRRVAQTAATSRRTNPKSEIRNPKSEIVRGVVAWRKS